MANGYLQVGQAVGGQPENNFIAGITVNGRAPNGGGKIKVSNIPLGSVALASVGTNTTDVAGQWWVTDIYVPVNRQITKIGVLQGGTATTDNILVAIWDSYGNLVGSSAVAGSLLSGANTFKELPLVLNNLGATVTFLQLYGPQQYFIGVQGNGTAAGAIQTVAAPYLDIASTVVSGTFGTIPALLTPPTTFTTANGPVVYVL